MTILVHPDEMLRQVSTPVVYKDGEALIQPLIAELIGTLRSHGNAVGLSAIQIGLPHRVFVMVADPKARMPEIVINPAIVKLSDKIVEVQEGCLSFPNVYEIVKRAERATVQYDTVDFPSMKIRQVNRTFDAFPAQIFQHEYDHLDGKLLIDRLDDRNANRITNKMKKWKMKGYIY